MDHGGHQMNPAPPEQSLGTRTLRGMVWAYGSYVGGRALLLVSTAVLARLLDPADFGLVALALVFIELLSMMRDFGVTQALIVADEDDLDARSDSAFVFTVLLGAALSAVVAASGPALAAFFDEPKLTGLMPLLALAFLLRSLGATHYALAQRRLDFRSRTAAELVDVVLRGAAGIAFALLGFEALSLVLGYVVGELALAVTIWVLVPWRPRLRMSWEHLRPLLGFGGALTGVSVIAAVLANVDYLFVGGVLGTTALGIYTLAFRLPDLLINNLTQVAGTVLFPAFATLSGSEMRSAYLQTIRYTVMLTLPLAVGLAILAEPVILATFGDKWREAIIPMQVLILCAFFPALTTPPGVIYKAIGRADILLKLALVKAPILIVAIALTVHHGITAVAACQAGVAMLFFIVTTALASRMLEVRARAIWKAVWPPVAAGAGLAAVLLVVHAGIDSPVPELLVGGLAGGTVYAGLLWLLVPDSLRALRERLLGSPAPVPAA